MITQEALEEYELALKAGQKEAKERTALGLNPNPEVLDEILPDIDEYTQQDVGLVEIPAERIVGIRSAGRISAFSAGFLPLLGRKTEFADKWISLCSAHLGEGIREPVLCFEYLGNFYIQEGNKRVSVLRHFGSPRIPGNVKRILPRRSEDPRILAYYEFLEFYKASKLYRVQFRRPGEYAKLLKALGKKSGEVWTEEERRQFRSYFHYFSDAFETIRPRVGDVLCEEALLLWLQLYPYENLGKLTAAELKKTVEGLAEDMVTAVKKETVKVQTMTEEGQKAGLLTRLTKPEFVRVAFVHQLTPGQSVWALSHEEGRKYIEEVFGDKISALSYYNANTPEAAEELIDKAVAAGAQVVFTTAPMLSRATLKAAVNNPDVKFFNCSVSQPYASIRTYYGRMYEAKFITGAIAGALAQNDRIGYIASYPIYGIPASINAFALGAQMTNPRAQIELSWSCCEGSAQADFFRDGIRVVSNREVPTQDKMYLDFCNYGTYLLDDRGGLISLGSPVWVWGKFYEKVVQALLEGRKDTKEHAKAVNYWLGMDSGIIDVELSDKLPAGVRSLAELLRKALVSGQLDPFARKIVAQDGTVKNDGTKVFTPEELLHMDWLCGNVIGEIPKFEQILPMSQAMVRELGIYRDQIPQEKEVASRENFDRIR